MLKNCPLYSVFLPIKTKKTHFALYCALLFVPFLYKTEINYLARVTKIMGIVNKNTRDYATSRYLTCVSK